MRVVRVGPASTMKLATDHRVLTMGGRKPMVLTWTSVPTTAVPGWKTVTFVAISDRRRYHGRSRLLQEEGPTDSRGAAPPIYLRQPSEALGVPKFRHVHNEVPRPAISVQYPGDDGRVGIPLLASDVLTLVIKNVAHFGGHRLRASHGRLIVDRARERPHEPSDEDLQVFIPAAAAERHAWPRKCSQVEVLLDRLVGHRISLHLAPAKNELRDRILFLARDILQKGRSINSAIPVHIGPHDPLIDDRLQADRESVWGKVVGHLDNHAFELRFQPISPCFDPPP